MNEREFLRAVRKLAEENNLDFLAATQNYVDWSFYHNQSTKLCELADVCKQKFTNKED